MPHTISATDMEIILRRAGKAFQVRDQWRSLLVNAYEFALPMRNTWETKTQGTQKMDRVFDSTAIVAAQKLAARLQSELTPIGQEWIDFVPGPFVQERIKPQVLVELQAAQKIFFAALAASNFPTSIAEFFLDLIIGTGAMLILEGNDDNFFNFISVPNSQIGIDEGPFGTVDGVFREHDIELRNIQGTWSDAKIPEDLTRMMASTPERKVTLIECTYFQPETDKYLYKVLWKKRVNSVKDATALVEREFDVHPWVITRWVKVSGEQFGRGPVIWALPDIKTINKVKEYILKNAAIAISGVWAAVDDGVINPATIAIRPGAVIPIGAPGNLSRLESNARFDVGQIVVEDLKQTIRTIMFDRSLPPDSGPVRSPTEIIERVKELQQDIGAPFGRLEVEMIRPIVKRCLNILENKGVLQFPIKVNGLTVDIQVNSPIARVQALNDIETVLRWMELSAGAGPEAFTVAAKTEIIPVYLAEKMGVDRTLLRSEEEREQTLAAVRQAAAQQGIGGTDEEAPEAIAA